MVILVGHLIYFNVVNEIHLEKLAEEYFLLQRICGCKARESLIFLSFCSYLAIVLGDCFDMDSLDARLASRGADKSFPPQILSSKSTSVVFSVTCELVSNPVLLPLGHLHSRFGSIWHASEEICCRYESKPLQCPYRRRRQQKKTNTIRRNK